MKDLRHQLVYQAKQRAKKGGLAFRLQASDIIIPKFCPALGIPLFQSSTGFPCDNSPTLDRVNNTMGYLPWNVKVISYKANMLKGNATADELQQIVNYMLAFQPLTVASSSDTAYSDADSAPMQHT